MKFGADGHESTKALLGRGGGGRAGRAAAGLCLGRCYCSTHLAQTHPEGGTALPQWREEPLRRVKVNLDESTRAGQVPGRSCAWYRSLFPVASSTLAGERAVVFLPLRLPSAFCVQKFSRVISRIQQGAAGQSLELPCPLYPKHIYYFPLC